ncbi:hypothetical protein GOP47_0012310 [Adiantum capillus-veneris]|uniref:Uncharacterized protein n=1 Tax=Adiantum capillus-veneris TaxID=13818 RepID=A0A9D4ZEB5_ADICA|nr:hypothetical protein GOP47_0012310 [Adiantum capillus-veneris]
MAGDCGEAAASPSEALRLKVIKHVNGLVDPTAAKRLEALKDLKTTLLGPHQKLGGSMEAEESHGNLHALQHFLEEMLAKPLLRRFADSSEKCRLHSISLLSEFLMLNPQSIAVLLPYIVSVISERFPLQAVPSKSSFSSSEAEYKGILMEPSEEVRLLLIQLVHSLIKEVQSLIGPFGSDIASILMCAAADKDPVVLVEVCSTLKLFAEVMEGVLKPVSKNLIFSILHALSHNRCRVRVVAIQAIEMLVLCGAHETLYQLTAYRDPNIIPISEFYHPSVKTQYLALLASDRSIKVREALLRTVTRWLLELPERREHEIRLLPYVLNGFIDENKELQGLAFDMMECIGQQYERENEDEVKDVKQYLTEDIEILAILKNGFQLPSFLKYRPCLGARIMVKRSFSIMLQALAADIQAWQQEPRLLAAKLLYVVLAFVEENATMHLPSLILILMKTCLDPSISEKIEECAKLVGHFVQPSAFLDILIPRISSDYFADAAIQDKGRGLLVLSWIMQGSRSSLLSCHIPDICSLLTGQDVLTSLQRGVHTSILTIIGVLVESLDETCKDEVITILWILLNANAAGTIIRTGCHEKVDCCLEKLSTFAGYDSTGALISAYADNLIDLLLPPQLWSSRSFDSTICDRLLKEGNLMSPATKERLCNMMEFYKGIIVEQEPLLIA